jgi:thioredoxin 1
VGRAEPADGFRAGDRGGEALSGEYLASEPSRAEVDALEGPTLLEFGSPWCGHCRRAQPLIAAALAGRPRLRHLKIADAPGRRLGRSFGVKLWPTLVLLEGGREAGRVVRPREAREIEALLGPSADTSRC